MKSLNCQFYRHGDDVAGKEVEFRVKSVPNLV